MMRGGTELREEIFRDGGDENGKGRGAFRRLIIIGLVIVSATVLIGVSTKADDESLIEWGSDVAEASAISIKGLGSYVAKAPAASTGVLVSVSSSQRGTTLKESDAGTSNTSRSESSAAVAVGGLSTSKPAGADSGDSSQDCPRCVKRAQMHLQRALANGASSVLVDGAAAMNN